MKDIKLKKLREIYEHGMITTDEYEKKKKEIEEMPEESQEENKEEEVKDTRTKPGIPQVDINPVDVKLKSDRTLIIGAVVIILLFAAIFGLSYFFKQEKPETIDDLHQLNFKGKLKKDQGYLYDGVYSFVKFDDVWYMQLISPSGNTLYNFNFRYSPRDLEDIDIKGKLDIDKFDNATQYYATFNPLGNNFTAVRLARLDYDLMMTRVFRKTPISACDRNVTNITTACVGVPIINCENTDEIVIYFNESDKLNVEYKDNCIIITGNGFDLVKGVDRVLYNLYGIMKQ